MEIELLPTIRPHGITIASAASSRVVDVAKIACREYILSPSSRKAFASRKKHGGETDNRCSKWKLDSTAWIGCASERFNSGKESQTLAFESYCLRYDRDQTGLSNIKSLVPGQLIIFRIPLEFVYWIVKLLLRLLIRIKSIGILLIITKKEISETSQF